MNQTVALLDPKVRLPDLPSRMNGRGQPLAIYPVRDGYAFYHVNQPGLGSVPDTNAFGWWQRPALALPIDAYEYVRVGEDFTDIIDLPEVERGRVRLMWPWQDLSSTEAALVPLLPKQCTAPFTVPEGWTGQVFAA